MNFPDLVRAVARETCWPKTRVERALRAGFRQLQRGLQQDGEVSIFGFGRFSVKDSPSRLARDFQTGEPLMASGRRKVKFTPYARTERAIAPRRKVRS